VNHLEIEFSIGNLPVQLKRGWFLGGMKLTTPNEVLWLQSPWNITTHFSLRRKKAWERTVGGHLVTVEKVRPLLVAGARPQHYRIFVDGQLVASAHGY
jgi:hypothetical protein